MDLIFCFARMQPITRGHLKIVQRVRELASNHACASQIVVSESHDRKRNPLDGATKLDFIRRALKNMDVVSSRSLNVFLEKIAHDGARDVVLVVGEDRAREFAWAIKDARRLGMTLEIENVERRQEDYSATAVRQCVIDHDMAAFSQMIPDVEGTFSKELFEALSLGMELNG